MPFVQFAIPMPKRKKRIKETKEIEEIKSEINTLPSELLTLSNFPIPLTIQRQSQAYVPLRSQYPGSLGSELAQLITVKLVV